ncbi:PKD domain-containing protein [Cytophagales bacterium LB-30]|uniref:PKD domain-containing protein n=1 Tax=Shiella aurantiaca TaxID=3058365 RepID=A0ABT8F329_9BACT|nr:PKD domain-containing protein [Shiella aurantiaca]MDN4164764.1 PKD domain-containing protein [Shiella aurantiaca]
MRCNAKYIEIIFLALLLAFPLSAKAQLSPADSLCVGAFISLNQPADFGDVAWDFCEGDLSIMPSSSLLSSSVASNAREIRLINEQGVNYALIITNNNTLLSLRLNADLTGINQILNLGNPDGMLDAPWGMDVIKEGDTWLAFVGNYNGSGKLVRLAFTGGLQEVPDADTLSLLNLPTVRNTGVAIFPSTDGSKRLVVTSTLGTIYNIDFGDSFLNSPTENDYTSSGILTNVFGLRIKRLGGKIYGFISTLSGDVQKLTFNENNSVINESLGITFPQAGAVKTFIALDQGVISLLRPNIRTTELLRLEIDPISYQAFGSKVFANQDFPFGISAFDAIKLNGKYIAFGVVYATGNLHRFEFSAPCLADQTSATEANPSITLQNPGNFYFSVTDQTTGAYQADSIFVRFPAEANFTTDFRCIGTPTQFYDSTWVRGAAVSSVLWDFGDPASGAANTSTAFQPSHDFSAPGLYTVRYTVTDACGRESVKEKQIRIFSENDADPDFSIVQPITCSFDSLQFQDESSFLTDEIVAWSWDFGDGNSSKEQNPQHAYIFSGDYTVQLSILLSSGCERSVSKPLTIINGSRIDFSVFQNCEGVAASFTDATVQAGGVTETSRLWNFDDPGSGADNTSTEENPSHTFAQAGIYLVSLEVSNSLGCVNTLTQRVEVFENPVILTAPQRALSNRPFRFRPDEIISKDTVESFMWDFNDNGAGSTEPEPWYTYTQTGAYTPSVQVTTQSGCVGSLTYPLEVMEGLADEDFPVVSYTATDTIDAQESILIAQSTTNYTDLVWDFDEGDLRDSAEIAEVTLLENTLLRQVRDVKLVQEAGIYYAIAVTNNSQLRVFKFADGLGQAPQVFDYGNPNELLLNPWGMDVVKENGKWRGLIANYGVGYGLTYFSFEQGLEQAPQFSQVPHTFASVRLANVALRYFQGDWWAITLGNSGQMEMLNFGGRLYDGVTQPIVHKVFTIVAGGYAFDVQVRNNQLYGAYVLTNGRHYIFRISPELQFSATEVTSKLMGINSLGSGIVAQDAGEWVHVFSDYNTGRIHRLTIPEDLALAKVKYHVLNGQTGIGFFAAMELVKVDSKWQGLGLNFSTGQLYHIQFPNPEDIVPLTSQELAPSVQYNTPGTYYFTLRATDHLGHTAYLTDSVRVRKPPVVNFTADFTCTYFDTFFSSDIVTDGTEIVSYEWDFGDPNLPSNTSAEANPVIRYPNPGIYTVSLTVVDDRGATGFLSQDIRIYPEDAFVPDFSLVSTPCTNNALFFDNSSIGLEEEIRSFRWDFGDPASGAANTSTEENPQHIYQEQGDYLVQLTAIGISGCEVSISKTFTINAAPRVDFTANMACVGLASSFLIDNLAPEAVTINWDFGDQSSANVESPEHVYQASGFYTVRLAVTYENACTFEQLATVFVPAQPVVDFQYEIPCEGSPTTFVDASTSADANIIQRAWYFENSTTPLITSDVQIQHTFSGDGIFSVTLETTTDRGCKSSFTQHVEVAPSPAVSFTWGTACEDNAVLFQETTATGVVSRAWRIGNTVYSEVSEVEHVFAQAGNYLVTLETVSANGCAKSITQTVAVYAQPLPQFEVLQNCAGEDVILQDISTTIDAITSRNWQWLEGQQSAEGEVVGFSIAQAGTYLVMLTVQTNQNCTAAITQSVQVFAPPVVSFRPSVNFGAPPLSVDFTNQSSGENSYRWTFGQGQGESQEVNPQYIFEDLGTYTVRLQAINNAGCEAITEQSIRVVEPLANAAVLALEQLTENGETQLLATLANKGTVVIENPWIDIQVNDELFLREQWQGTLLPNTEVVYPLTFSLANVSAASLQYICVRLGTVWQGYTESDIFDNQACLSFSSDFQIGKIFPNPAGAQIQVPVVIPVADAVQVEIISDKGQIVFSQAFRQTVQGLNAFTIATDAFGNGVYFVRVTFQNKVKQEKIMVLR